jgi:hypothetical protein
VQGLEAPSPDGVDKNNRITARKWTHNTQKERKTNQIRRVRQTTKVRRETGYV